MDERIYFEKILSQDDFEYFLDLVSNEKVMVMNYGRVFTLKEAKKVYKGILEKNEVHEEFGQFKVFEATTNTFIGIGGLIMSDDFTEAEVEYLLLPPEYWGMGYGSEILRELLNKAESVKSIQQVIGIIAPNNIASRKILSNNGFVSCKVYEIDDGSFAEVLSKKITV
ncbi:GNAT family N-acetyltransferase [Clostridium subterminale]|uniref:GNAT family N-acetyltransferase n=1 Tax=Clostridium subterminale TaxID=1550 RepID=A0ABP3W1V1_CLOSU